MLKALLIGLFLFFAAGPAQALDESAYDRVLKNRTIRCGYAYWEPGIMRDEKTGRLHGAFFEYVERLGRALDMKIEWAEQVDWGSLSTALKAGRVDAICAGAWANTKRGIDMLVVSPIWYNPVGAFVRADDKRFDNGLSAVDSPDVTVAGIDGEIALEIARNDFPKAKTYATPYMNDDVLLSVATGKGDITFAPYSLGQAYERENAGKIRRIPMDQPVRVYGSALMLGIHEHALKAMIENATAELANAGIIDRIVAEYGKKYPGTFIPAAKPYVLKGTQ